MFIPEILFGASKPLPVFTKITPVDICKVGAYIQTVSAENAGAGVNDVYLGGSGYSFKGVITVLEPKIKVTASKQSINIGEDVTFTATLTPANEDGKVSWEGGNNPASGEGLTFTTNFDTDGEKTVTATWLFHKKKYTGSATVTVLEPTITITADKEFICIKENVTFTATLTPANMGGDVSWTGGGNPADGGGLTFTTNYDTEGVKTVTATWHFKEKEYTASKDVTVVKVELSPDPVNVPFEKTATATATITPDTACEQISFSVGDDTLVSVSPTTAKTSPQILTLTGKSGKTGITTLMAKLRDNICASVTVNVIKVEFNPNPVVIPLGDVDWEPPIANTTATITPASTYDQVFFEISNEAIVTVAPTEATQAIQKLTLTGKKVTGYAWLNACLKSNTRCSSVDVYVPKVEVRINDTTDTSDDLVMYDYIGCGKYFGTMATPKTPCQIEAMNVPPGGLPVILSGIGDDGWLRIGFSKPGSSKISNELQLVLPESLPVSFDIVGNVKSEVVNDALILVGTNMKDGNVNFRCARQPLTVFWFDTKLSAQAENAYFSTINGDNTVTLEPIHDPAMSMTTDAQLRPVGVNAQAPQVWKLSNGIKQQIMSNRIRRWTGPIQITWDATVKPGTTVSMPQYLYFNFSTNGGWVSDAFDASDLPLYHGNDMTDIGTPSRSVDTPKEFYANEFESFPRNGCTGLYSLETFEMQDNFVVFGVIYDAAANTYIAMKQLEWQCNASIKNTPYRIVASSSHDVTIKPVDTSDCYNDRRNAVSSKPAPSSQTVNVTQ